ncbi:MAG: hypothetical protein GX595_13415 [Lentisphaerae bacterium]|nr:hypothetical protein [Lentisphaerota bacterium]
MTKATSGCLAVVVISATAAVAAPAAPALTAWPPRDTLVQSLAAGIEPILKTQDEATGRFGSQPWICNDQNVLMPLAAAWAIEHPDNPWHHDARLLKAIAAGGRALVEDQDATGRWIFRKKDNSTWGMIHMPWTYSRWIRAYVLVREALEPADRETWERGLRLGFTGIRKYMDGHVHNIPCHHAMGLYIAGQALGEPEWCAAAKAFMGKVVAKQDPGGFWSENFGPVIGYNEVYVDALGAYYHASQDDSVLEALRHSAQFHAAVLWPDGSAAPCFDERQIYHRGIRLGSVGFTFTPEGRGYLLQQLGKHLAAGGKVGAEWAASMLLYGGQGDSIAPAAAGDEATVWIGNRDGLIQRRKPWQWAFSAYVCPPPKSRWIQDRHNLVDIFHDRLGLVIGGGNTKLQPWWSTFTRGVCSLLQHRPGDENPDFRPAIDLTWVPEAARLEDSAGTTRLALTCGGQPCSVQTAVSGDGDLALIYEAPAGQGIEAHVPFLNRGRRLTTAAGEVVRLGEDDLVIPSERLGGGFDYAGLRVGLPAGASLRWPARQHDPYKKDGSSGLGAAKLVAVLPFTTQSRCEVTLHVTPEEVFNGKVFEARDLPLAFSDGSYTKRLDDLGSQFLGGGQIGQWMRFTLPTVPAGRYELLGEFVTAYTYGVIQVSANGRAVGKPFDAYTTGVDPEGERVSFGTVDLTGGETVIEVKVTARNAQATNQSISVRRWLLRQAE